MKKKLTFLIIILINIYLYAGEVPRYFSYLEPLPGAVLVNKESSIIIRPSSIINKSSIDNKAVIVTGSLSGTHNGVFINSDDNNTIIFKPSLPFLLGENVTVNFNSNVKSKYGKSIGAYTYSFTIKSKEIISSPLESILSELGSNDTRNNKYVKNTSDNTNDFPVITVNNSSTPSDGYIFLSNIVFNPQIQNSPYLLILNNNAQPYYQKSMSQYCFDFKLQSNGNLTYYMAINARFYEMDTSYNLIDSFYCGNNYSTDAHEFRILPNRHSVLLSYDPETVDMSHIVNGGNPNATVIGLILQEIDANKNVVFQWRSWDHYQITDATHENLDAAQIDYVHGNAVEIDNDGNFLLSCRHMDEITKINSSNGNIIWRMGGKNNQFTFVNDDIGFSHQHAIRRIANGNITLFDNGNFHTPSFSRAVEYTLNEQTKTATLVWQYRNNPDIYGSAMGYVERLDNNNTLIGWGATNPSVTEVKYDGTKVYELTFADQVYSYRAYRYKWKEPVQTTVLPASFNLRQNYPNPFNPVTNIEFDIPQLAGVQTVPVRLIVYDVLGRQVSVPVNEQMQPGIHTVGWNAGGFSSGIYFYKLIAGDYIATKKMMLVK